MKTYPDNFVMKIHGNKFQKVGVPDLLIIISGKVFFIETKFGNGTLRPAQKSVIKELRNAGVVADVAYSLEEAKQIIEEGKTLWNS